MQESCHDVDPGSLKSVGNFFLAGCSPMFDAVDELMAFDDLSTSFACAGHQQAEPGQKGRGTKPIGVMIVTN